MHLFIEQVFPIRGLQWRFFALYFQCGEEIIQIFYDFLRFDLVWGGMALYKFKPFQKNVENPCFRDDSPALTQFLPIKELMDNQCEPVSVRILPIQ